MKLPNKKNYIKNIKRILVIGNTQSNMIIHNQVKKMNLNRKQIRLMKCRHHHRKCQHLED